MRTQGARAPLPLGNATERRISALQVACVVAAVTQQKHVPLVNSAADVAHVLLFRALAIGVFWSCLSHSWAHGRTLSGLYKGLADCRWRRGDGRLEICSCWVEAVGFILPARRATHFRALCIMLKPGSC